ncbi:MAG: hypothetical protein H6739_22870 [Alphaproteobacteria bacterium]|nr:hypothetical protein [Alphaproteobacteria bacterium]
MRKMTLAALLVLGCGDKDDTATADDTSVEGDADTDTDSDTDADADPLDGIYQGAWSLSVEETNTGDTDSCVGTVDLEVTMANTNEQFVGLFACDFSGFLAQFNPMEGSVYGLVTQFGELAASYETGGGPIEGDWSGTIDEATGIYGSFEGSASGEGMDLSWAGSLTATKQP